jgi:hypothetical protein
MRHIATSAVGARPLARIAKEVDMDTFEPGSEAHFDRSPWLRVVGAILKGLLYFLRVVIFAPLAIFEPVIGTVLAGICFMGLCACLFFKVWDPAGVHHVHYGVLITVSLSSGVLFVLYYKLMRWLAP